MIRLAGTYEDFLSRFRSLTTLIGLSARMVNDEDRRLTKAVIGLDVKGFLAGAGPSIAMINNTTMKCSQDGATIAKSQEIQRVFNEAIGVVKVLAERLGTTR